MKTIRRISRGIVLAMLLGVLAFLYIGVQGANATPVPVTATARATINPALSKSKLNGQVAFTETPKGLVIQATINDAPAGFHGFHIHDKGSCRDGGKAAGGHFNPDQRKHGKLLTDGFSKAHAGDLGNILIGTDGKGTLSQTLPGLTLTEGKYAIANHAIILHAQRDDFSQPTGNAGDRLGCGVIALSKDLKQAGSRR